MVARDYASIATDNECMKDGKLTLLTTTSPLHGFYPLICKLQPLHGAGKDNMGIGYTQHNEKFLVKNGGAVGIAEFIGAKLCDACGIPACQPTIVAVEELGRASYLFGSRIESGVHVFDQTLVKDWQRVLSAASNVSAFSALLAVDLVLGNDDRHWNNWLVQEEPSPSGGVGYRLRAMDFSRSWPTQHPAQHPLRHGSVNTWQATKDWEMLGVDFDLHTFHETCAKIGRLKSKWLRSVVLQPLVGVYLSEADAEMYTSWWDQNIRTQATEAVFALEYGVWQ